MMNNSNSVVIHVIRAKELRLKKHKELDVQVSLNTAGNSKWKSKVSTNSVRTTDGNCEFGEHCELYAFCAFSQLTEEDLELHISVNHKTMIGTTESMGQYTFVIERMSRYQPPAWFRLSKRGRDDKEYGYIQLEYQFANKLTSSVSNFSLNKVEKERKFDKLVNKMKLIAKKRDTTADDKSMVSVSLSHKSSFSSNTSALAFSSPSPNHMAMTMAANDQPLPGNQITPLRPADADSLNVPTDFGGASSRSNSYRPIPTDRSSLKRDSIIRNEKGFLKEMSDFAADSDNANSVQSVDPPRNITAKVRHRAEQILHLRHRKQNSEHADETGSRPSSIASSSGFASLSSNNLGALNENTSPEHLLSVIKHLRHEILAKENRICDLEEYTDRLLSKIIVYNPELLQVDAGAPPAAVLRS